jgi:hypothetical protein
LLRRRRTRSGRFLLSQHKEASHPADDQDAGYGPGRNVNHLAGELGGLPDFLCLGGLDLAARGQMEAALDAELRAGVQVALAVGAL